MRFFVQLSLPVIIIGLSQLIGAPTALAQGNGASGSLGGYGGAAGMSSSNVEMSGPILYVLCVVGTSSQ